jgi:Glyoxalase/Bleomycin resistance protein/Dioxygenase superfamily
MAPNMPADPTKPVGKFYTKFGQHLHSVGYKVDDLVGLGNRLIDSGVYIGAPGGGRITEMSVETVYFYPSPRDTAGLMVELCRTDMRNDPRQRDTRGSQVKFWELLHPPGIKRLAYITLGVRDLPASVETYVKVMQAVPIAEGIDDGGRFRYAIVRLGDCLLQLAQPLDDASPLGAHVATWGNMIYGITFEVDDLDAAQEWLRRKKIGASRPRPGLLAADPADCFGAPYFFTTDAVPNDPFGH